MVIIEKCSQHYVCLLSKKRPLVELGQSVDSGTHRKITVKIRYEEECKTFMSSLDQLEGSRRFKISCKPSSSECPAIIRNQLMHALNKNTQLDLGFDYSTAMGEKSSNRK